MMMHADLTQFSLVPEIEIRRRPKDVDSFGVCGNLRGKPKFDARYDVTKDGLFLWMEKALYHVKQRRDGFLKI